MDDDGGVVERPATRNGAPTIRTGKSLFDAATTRQSTFDLRAVRLQQQVSMA